MKIQVQEKINDSLIFEKKRQINFFSKISHIYSFLNIFSVESRAKRKKDRSINGLIESNNFSTLFELINIDYELTDKQLEKMYKKINFILLTRSYEDKLYIVKLMEEKGIEIKDENYFYFFISNKFNELFESYILNKKNMNSEDLLFFKKLISKFDDENFKKLLHKFIVEDIVNSPTGFGSSLNWSCDRNAYFEPLKNKYLFEGMTKKNVLKIIKSFDRVGLSVVNEFKSLLNRSNEHEELIKDLGLDIKSLITKAKKEIKFDESELSNEMKEVINRIIKECEKAEKNENPFFKYEINNISNIIMPNIIKKYLSIDLEYRNTLKNIEGKLPGELLLESLINLHEKVKKMNFDINEEKISELSIENRKLKF